jgi:hypothetical protein
VLYHQVWMKLPEEDLLEQVNKAYAGKWVSGVDLGVY